MRKRQISFVAAVEITCCRSSYTCLLSSIHMHSPQVIQCQNRSSSELCIFRVQVPVSDILSHLQLIHEQTVKDHDVSAPSEMDSQYITNIPRHCLRSSMVFSAPHCNYYSRHTLVVAEVPHLVNTVPVSFEFLKNYLDNVVIAVRGTDTVEVSEVKDVLPEYIYLNKNDFYNFDVTMTLDTSILSTGEFVCLSFCTRVYVNCACVAQHERLYSSVWVREKRVRRKRQVFRHLVERFSLNIFDLRLLSKVIRRYCSLKTRKLLLNSFRQLIVLCGRNNEDGDIDEHKCNLILQNTISEFELIEMDINKPEIGLNEAEMDLNKPEIDLNESEIELNESEIYLNKSEMDLNESEMDLNESEIYLNKSEMDLN